MQRIMPCLWFDDQGEEAVQFYTGIFKDSKIKIVTRYGKAGTKQTGKPAGSVMTILFELEGQEFLALNGGPHFKFSPAVSLVVNCKTQKEIDRYWEALSAGGQKGQCGWLTDKFGVSWQIVPDNIGKLLKGADVKKTDRIISAILKMKKLDLKVLRAAEKS